MLYGFLPQLVNVGSRWPQLRSIGWFAVAAVVLIGHALAYNFVTDDAYISFVYSRNLAEHGQLTFNLGEHVEGYTNFLWTVFLAGWMKLGWLPESSSLFFGPAFASAVTLYQGMKSALVSMSPRMR